MSSFPPASTPPHQAFEVDGRAWGHESGPGDVAARSPWQLFWRRFRRDRVAVAGLVFIAVVVLAAMLAPLIVQLVGARDPQEQSTEYLDSFGLPVGPGPDNLFGADPLGRDVFSRVLYGAGVSLQVAFLSTGLAALVGVTVGLLAGYHRGWADAVLSRAMDLTLAFPVLLLGIGLGSACSVGAGCAGGLVEPGLPLVVLIIALATWPSFARLVRGQVLSLRETQFVEAARALGASGARIVFREILPNLLGPIMVYATLLVPANILLEAALSFLGVGVQGRPTWGEMIAEATQVFDTAWWFMLFPGLALVLTVLAFNLVGDGLRDALDPRSDR